MAPTNPDPPPFSYPRAGARGSPPMSRWVEELLADLLAQGVPPEALGPTLVRGYARIYRRLPRAADPIDKTQVPMLYSLLGSGTAPLKMSKDDAAYQGRPHPSGQKCGNCSSAYQNVVSGDVVCSQVSGTIELSGWCRLWNTDRF